MRDVEHFMEWIFTPQIKGLRNFIYCESLNDLLNEILHARRYNLFQFLSFLLQKTGTTRRKVIRIRYF